MRAARPVIVVSTGRSGSTMLSNMVRGHPELLSLSELFILLGDPAFPDGPVSGARFWDILSRPHRTLHVLQRSGVTFAELLYEPGPGDRFTVEAGIPPLMLVPLPHLVDDPEALFDEIGTWAVELDAKPVADQYRRLFDWLCRRLGRRIWIERSGASLPMVDVLARQFPEAGIVHLYRDGRECAMSMSRHDGFKLMAFRHQPGLTPPGMQRDGLIDREVLRRAVVPPEVCGEVWSDLVGTAVARLAELTPDRVLRMSYEALTADPRAELRRLTAFIGVESDPGWLETAAAIVRTRPPSWAALPEPQRQRLVDACAPGMDLLYASRE
jgi:putative sulfotransferase